jgi:hypothetical protein
VIFAYADPPYPGMANLYPEQREVDHVELIDRLIRDYPDGWALSTSVPALRWVWPMCPAKTRAMAWVKPFAVFKPNVNPAYAWEPVLVYGGRPFTREQETIRDWVSACITLQRGVVGAKPDEFCVWLFRVLNMRPGDELHDLFPGSGAVTRAWESYCRQLPLTPTGPAGGGEGG